jgi:hypothetical protein
MNLRLEEEKDYSTVENLTREAFWNIYRPGCDEHLLILICEMQMNLLKDLIMWQFTINTMKNAIFMDRVNDLSLVYRGALVTIIEHQSTINPNMALRLLLYAAKLYEKMIDGRQIYSTKKMSVPRPEFIVLYNGKGDLPAESVLKLSDMYKELEGTRI